MEPGIIPQQTTENSATDNPLLSRETLRRIHSYMLQCRARGNGSGSGMEAIEVPLLAHLRPGDTVTPTGSRWLFADAQHTPLARMTAELFPEHGERGFPSVISNDADPVALVGVATGVAFASKLQGPASLTVVLGDRGMLESPSADVLAIAGEKKLPVIYVILSPRLKLSPAKARKVEDEMNVKMLQCGFPAIPVDARDAIAVYRVAQEAIARARKGGGPTLIECKMLPGAMDPILHIENYMRQRGL